MDGKKASSTPAMLAASSILPDDAASATSTGDKVAKNGSAENDDQTATNKDNTQSMSSSRSVETPTRPAAGGSAYEKIEDVARLQRLIVAKTKTRETLEAKAAWAGSDMADADADGTL
jgi:hypothetical protein